MPYTPESINNVSVIYGSNPLNDLSIPIFDASLINTSGNISINLDTNQYPQLSYELFVYLLDSNEIRLTPYLKLNGLELSLAFESKSLSYRRLGTHGYIQMVSFQNWHHIALEISDVVNLFIDGQLVTSDTYNSKGILSARFGSSNGNWFHGSYFLQLALWKKLLSGGNNSFTPPSSPYMKF